MHHLRKITADELPRVRDDDTDELRPATERELRNFGLVRVGDDLYDCAHVDGDPDPPWGVRVIQGHLGVRYGKLPPRVGAKVRRARVLRADGHSLAGVSPERIREHHARRNRRGRPSRIRALEVREGEVLGTDVVEERDVPPNRWRGERRGVRDSL